MPTSIGKCHKAPHLAVGKSTIIEEEKIIFIIGALKRLLIPIVSPKYINM